MLRLITQYCSFTIVLINAMIFYQFLFENKQIINDFYAKMQPFT